VPGWIGVPELLVLLLVVLLVFGPKRLPEMGRSLGRGMREFKDSISGDKHLDEEHRRPELTAAEAQEDRPVVVAQEDHPVAVAQQRSDEREPTP
jgi:sec-independent protein translocase protein TatA